MECFAQAVAAKDALADHLGKITILVSMANVSSGIANPNREDIKATQLPPQVREYLEQALKLSREIKHRGAEQSTLETTANQYRLYGLIEKFIEYKEQSLAIERETVDRKTEANILHHIGFSLYSKGYHEKALEYYQRALAINLAENYPAGQALNYREFSNTYFRIGNILKAIEYQEKALAIWRELKNESQIGASLGNLGNIYGSLGRYLEALENFEQSLAIDRKTKNRGYEAISVINIGEVYFKLGRYDKSVEYYELTLTIARELGKNSITGREIEGGALQGLGNIAYKQGMYDKALLNYEQALKIFRTTRSPFFEAATLNDIANTKRTLSLLDEAISFDLQALAITRKIKASDQEGIALSALQQDWKARNQPQLAIYFGKQAVNLYQEIRSGIRSLDQQSQQSFIKSKESTYRDLADLLISQGRLPEAEQVIRMLKEEEFFDYIRRDQDNSPKGDKAALTPEEAAIEKRYREIADQLTILGTERGELLGKSSRTTAEDQRLAKLEADLTIAGQAFQKFLDGLSVEFAKKPDNRVFQLREAQGLMEDLRELGKGTVALYTLVGEKKFRVILTTPDVQKAYEAPIGEAALNRKILALRTALQNPKLDPRPAAQELYQILFAPLAKDLRAMKATTLMWSLDGMLRYVPMGALYDGEKYLVEHFRHVVFTPASNARLKDQVSANWQALGLGVTRGFGANIPALPAVADEMRGIIREVGQAGSNPKGVLPGTIRLDGQFTQEAMLAGLRQKPSVVHVASHFQFKPGNETDSALLLGDGKFLSLAQIKSLPNVFSGVELLTLSACNTATSGSGANGKEVEGFGVLAQRQGAKAVVASLWPVADRTTQLLMEEFYRGREAHKLTKGEAMRQAQLKLLRGELTKQASEALANREIAHEASTTTASPFKVDAKRPHAHPYFWAPFILIGNWK